MTPCCAVEDLSIFGNFTIKVTDLVHTQFGGPHELIALGGGGGIRLG